MTGISFIVPSLGRPSLAAALQSITTQPGDEILVIGSMGDVCDPRVRFLPCSPGGDWGCRERTLGIQAARGAYLAFLDDDDVYTPWARAVMGQMIAAIPDRPMLFRMQYPNQFILWHDPHLRCGNVSTQMMLVPNVPAKLGRWTPRREGDFDFLTSMAWAPDAIVWHPAVIARLGHNDVC